MPETTTTQAGRDAGTLARLLEDLAQRAKAPRDSVHAAGIEAARADALAGLAAALTGATPAEVDTAAAPLEMEAGRLISKQITTEREARRQANTPGRFAAERAARLEAEAADLSPKIAAALDACEPYRAEYRRRGGWPRIYWCTANGGHAHASTSCRTLHLTTEVVWLPEWSGRDEAAMVEAAGEAACSVCYPSAPVAVLARPSQLRPAREERERLAAVRADREEKRAAKASKGITAPDGSPLRVDGSVIGSEVTARNEYVRTAAEAADHAEGLTAWGDRPDLAERYGRHAAQLLEALAHKHGRAVEEERAELAEKVAGRRKKDARERARYANR